MVAGPGDSPGPPDEWDGPSALPQYTETVPFKQVGRADTKKCFVNPDSVNTIKDPMEKRIEMLLRAKLLEWDKDQSGTFNFEQVKDAMAEIRDVANHIGTLRQYIAFAGLLLVALVPVFIGVGYVALTASKEVYVGHSGSLEALRPGFDDREVVVTTQEYNFQNVQNMLDFDLVTNEWVVSNFALREMDSVSFELVNGSYYHFDVVEVTREDSGQDGESDKLEVTTTNGAKLRLWESLESLEAKWAGSSMWELLDVRDEDAYADPNGQLHEVAEPPEQGPASLRPPGRLLAKGAGGGGVGFGRAGPNGLGTNARAGIYSGVMVGSMYHHRPYHGSSARQCYSDERYVDGQCVKNSACTCTLLFATLATICNIAMNLDGSPVG
mmetsp:Transcript_90198/g.254469  ORF Transcript_90198/g.254469 Transcript_90198/m.254469 type:complete len:382 (-) Transcript_90198:138-1283(-)